MKIFDATAVIAFLTEMDFPEAFTILARHYKIIIPQGVATEIKKQPAKQRLQDLVERKVVKIVDVDINLTNQVQNSHPQLHLGECQAIAYVQSISDEEKVCIVSDDYKARKIFQKLNFKWTERLLDIMKEKEFIDANTYSEKMKKLQDSPFYSRGKK